MAEDRRIQIGLSFTADASKARQELEKLKNDLSKTITSVNIGKSLSPEFDNAIEKATRLRGILDGATDSVGNFDLTKFTRELDKSGMSMKEVYTSLHRIGADGAFNKLAEQIQGADARVNVLTGHVKKFFDGLKNTAMWTLQSNAIHGVQSALQGAYNYAQKLNKGLTDIAIVSDLNTKQLTEFARTANRMANELSASTSDVVSGALIYYQAGLSDEEVIKRTETTIKLAQTSGESAEQISSYMTAIWNNFYDGSKSVEYYADAISYLGAVTAASNADIAEGMQSFAATAETVGLSFEYGASALTLLRDVTQQSASTIGNSLKTIFARLSSVKQGETLEDGVDLTKYSKALESVGVQVLDINGDLRSMDNILDDLAGRWDLLNSAQKAALAQTVGGVRQYNNLISLMDNYERFQELVSGAQGSNGYLQNQADEYAESWEAAKNRLTAAWQGIYDQLINDKFFIQITNFFSGLVRFIGQVIDGVGGLKGVISLIAMAITSIKPNETALRLQDIVQQLRELREALNGVAESNNRLIQQQAGGLLIGSLDTDNQKIFGMIDTLRTKQEEYIQGLGKKRDAESSAEKVTLQRYAAEINHALKLEQTIKQLNERYKDLDQNALANLQKNYRAIDAMNGAQSEGQRSKIAKQIRANAEEYGFKSEDLKKFSIGGKESVDNFFAYIQTRTQLAHAELEAQLNVDGIVQNLKTKFGDTVTDDKLEQVKAKINELTKDFTQLPTSAKGLQELVDGVATAMGITDEKGKELIQTIIQGNRYIKSMQPEEKTVQNWSKITSDLTRAVSSATALGSAMDSLVNGVKDGTATFSSVASSIASIGFSSMSLLKLGGDYGIIPKSLLGPAGIAILVGITALIKAVSIAVERFKESLPEGQLVAANAALEEHKKLLNQVNSEYEETNNTLDKLSKADDTFNKLKRGTLEWTQAVYENNQAVLDLLASYGLLGSPGMYNNVKGYLSLTEDAIKQIQALQTERSRAAILGTYAAQGNVAQKRTGAAAQRVKSVWNSATSVFATGSVGTVGLDDNTPTAFDQTRAEAVVAEFAKGTFQIVGDQLVTIADTGFELNDAEIELIKTSEEFRQALQNAATETQQAWATEETYNQQIGNEIINQIGGANIPDYLRDEVAGQVGSQYNTQYNEKKSELDQLGGAALWDQYGDQLKQLGYNYIAGENKFYNAAGEETNGEMLRRALANQIVMVEIANPDTIATAMNSIDAQTQADAFNKYNAAAPERARMEREFVEGSRITGAETDAETLGIKAETVESVSEEIGYLVEKEQEYDKESRKFSDSTFKNEGSLKKLAVAAEQTQEGFDELEKGYSDWYKAIKGNDPLAAAKAMDELKDSLADIMNISDELANSEYGLGEYFGTYITDHQDTVLAALKGDQDAIIELQHVAAQDLIMQLNTDQLLVDTETAKSIIDDHMALMQEALADGTLKLGAVDDSALLESLSNTINSLTNDVGVAQQILARMGYDAEVEETEVTDRQQYWVPPVYRNVNYPGASPSTQTELLKEGYWEDVASPVTHHALRIKTADYVGGGNILGAKGGTGAGRTRAKNATTGKGGGGGSSSKTKTKDVERYHEITSQLEQTAHALDMVNAQEDQAYGPDKLALMDDKIKLLERETEQYKQLYDEAKSYYDADRAHLADGYGAQFNPDGSIANYDTWYKQFVDKYNSGQMDDDAWSLFEDAIKKYEDSLKHLNDAEKNVQDNLIEIYNVKLEKIEYKLKYLNKLIDQDLEYFDYMIDQLDKDMYKTADVLDLMGQKMGDVLEKANNEREAIASILEGHGLGEDQVQAFLDGQLDVATVLEQVGQLTEEEINDLQNHQSALLDYNKTLIQIREESYEKIAESISEFNDQIERQIDIIHDLDGVMSHYKNIIDIVGKDVLGVTDDMLGEMDQLSVLAAQSALEISTDQMNKNKEILEDLYEQRRNMAEEASEEDLRLMDEQIQEQEDVVRGLTESWASSWENALQVAETAFKNSLDRVTDAFSAAMAGSLGNLDNLQEAFNQQKQLNERYLPMYQRIYELNKLTRDVSKAIDNTNNIAGKERLLKLQQEILERQQSGAEITEYEVGMLQRRIELEQARIAMEEAQNAKSMVRMTRDNEGNWSYTYTADGSKAAEAQQNYEDRLYDLKKYNQESLQEFEEAMWKAVEDYKNSIKDLDLTDSERVARIKAFQEEWVAHNGRMFQMAIDDAHWIIGEYNDGLDDLQDNFSDTVSGQITDYSNLQDVMTTFGTESASMISGVTTAYTTWSENHQAIFVAAGSSVDTFAQKVADDMDAVKKAMVGDGDEDEGAVGKAKQFGKDMKAVFNDILTHIKNWLTGEDGYFNQIDKITNKNEVWNQSLQNLITQYEGVAKAAEEAAKAGQQGDGGTGSAPSTSGSGSGSGSGGGGSSSGGGGNTYTPVWTYTEIRNPGGGLSTYTYKKDEVPNSLKKPGWQWRKLDQKKSPMGDWYYPYGKNTETTGGNTNNNTSGSTFNLRNVSVSTMASGGYTGAWGPEGKMAVLHEKELVLSAKDTENLLATVGFVRDITQMLSLNASAMSGGLGALSSGTINQGGGYLDQNVTIHAEFPNATNHSEIEEAFNNLIGLASQYAGRKQ